MAPAMRVVDDYIQIQRMFGTDAIRAEIKSVVLSSCLAARLENETHHRCIIAFDHAVYSEYGQAC